MNKPMSLADKVEVARQHYNDLVAASHPAKRTGKQQCEIYDALSRYEHLKFMAERRKDWARMEARNVQH